MPSDRKFGPHLVWVVFAVGFLMSPVTFSQVQVNPVVIELAANQRAATVKISLSDTAKAPIRLQAELLRWEQNIQGEDLTIPGNDLLVTPPIATIQPGETQLFRIAIRGTRSTPEEIAYRLIFEDIAEPSPPASDNASPGGASIDFRMRYDLPVMVAPTGKIINALRWKPCPAGNPAASRAPVEACVRLNNAGNRRVKVQNLMLAGDGWQQAMPLKDGINVLVGAEREWRVPLQPGQTGALRGVQVQTARGETLQAAAGGF